MTTVTRRKPRATTPTKTRLSPAKLRELYAEHKRAKDAATAANAVAESTKKTLMAELEANGVAHGEKGQHLAIALPEPVDGITTLVRRANKSTYINVDKAEALATEGGYLEHIQAGRVVLTFEGTPAEARALARKIRKAALVEEDQVSVDIAFSQERLMAYHQRHRDVLTEDMLDGLYETDVRYSFNPE